MQKLENSTLTQIDKPTVQRPSLLDKTIRLIALFMPGGFRLVAVLLISLVYSSIVCVIDLHAVPSTQTFQGAAALSVSVVFGLLLIFRNNSAYERWWEARKLWGQLVNDSRNLAIKIESYGCDLSQAERTFCAELIASFAESLKMHLRGERNGAALLRLELPPNTNHIPSAIALVLYKKLKLWRKQSFLGDWEQIQIDSHARAFMDICGATERILKSPIASSYKLLLWIVLLLNLACLPWLLAPMFHGGTVVIMLVSCYLMFGLEMLAEDVERPFDDSANDLPLDDICANIRASVFQLLSSAPSDNDGVQ
ncbi:MAG TPA: bestrophin family ion channel [Drouetiella sp.]